MHRAARFSLLAPLVASLAFAACSADEASESEVRADVAAQLEESGLSEADAECVAGVLVDEVGVEEIRDINVSDDEPGGELGEAIAAAMVDARGECEIDADGG